MASPLWFVRSGRVNGSGGLNYSGSYGNYWSSTVYNTTISYDLLFLNTSVNPDYSNDRLNGFSVRCMSSAS